LYEERKATGKSIMAQPTIDGDSNNICYVVASKAPNKSTHEHTVQTPMTFSKNTQVKCEECTVSGGIEGINPRFRLLITILVGTRIKFEGPRRK
jgi:hypothetical protein